MKKNLIILASSLIFMGCSQGLFSPKTVEAEEVSASYEAELISTYELEEYGWIGTIKAVNSIVFDENAFYAVGDDNSFYKGSVDGSTLTRYKVTTDEAEGFSSVSVYEDELYIVTSSGALLVSKDKGNTFAKYTYGKTSILGALMASNGTHYVLRDNRVYAKYVGSNDFDIVNNKPEYQSEVGLAHYIDEADNLWVITRSGKAYVSKDGGTTFTTNSENEMTEAQQASVLHVDPNGTIWFGTRDGIIGQSKDEGATFKILDLKTVNSLADFVSDVQFTNGHLWVCIGSGASAVVKITDGSDGLTGEYQQGGTGFLYLTVDQDNNLWSGEYGGIGRNVQNLIP